MSSTFTTSTEGTVSFVASSDSWSEESTSEVSVVGYPGGDSVAISLSGQRETRRAFTAVLDSLTDYVQLKSMRSRAGTLLVENWDVVPVQAVLTRIAPDGPWLSGEITCKVSFILY